MSMMRRAVCLLVAAHIALPCAGFKTSMMEAEEGASPPPSVKTTKISTKDIIDGICKKTKEQLMEQINEAISRGEEGISMPMQTGREALAKVVYTSMAKQIRNLGSQAPLWKGCTSVPEPTPQQQMAESMLSGFDTNKDGKLTREEVKQLIDQHNSRTNARQYSALNIFARIDSNGDGFVDANELSAMAKMFYSSPRTAAPPEQRSKEEMHGEMFRHLDTDGDGVLSLTELYTMVDSKDNNTGGAERASDDGRRQNFFKTVDSNGDGSVDRTEAMRFFTQTANAAQQAKA
jgi:Ca2+-binding EF-hand superfamily protein